MNEVILGIDPGTLVTGFGIIQVENGSFKALDYGCIRPPASLLLSNRYFIIFEGVKELILKYKPQGIAVEAQYVSQNVQSALKLGMAKGAAIIAAKSQNIPVYEYAPSVAKLAVTGNGKASKEQVQAMCKHLLQLDALPSPFDAADALSLAICCAHSQSSRKEM